MKKLLSFADPLPPLPTQTQSQTVVASVPTARRVDADGLERRVRGASLRDLELGVWHSATFTNKSKKKRNREEGWYEWLQQVTVNGTKYFIPANDAMSDKLDDGLELTNGSVLFVLKPIEGSTVRWADPMLYQNLNLV